MKTWEDNLNETLKADSQTLKDNLKILKAKLETLQETLKANSQTLKADDEGEKVRKSEESRIQTEAFVWLWNTYPETRGLFFTVMNETTPRYMGKKEQAILGAMRRMRGIVAGVSDGVFLMPNGKYHFCCAEAKTTSANSRQSDAQKEFQQKVETVGGYYFIYRTLDEFKKEMENYLFDNKS